MLRLRRRVSTTARKGMYVLVWHVQTGTMTNIPLLTIRGPEVLFYVYCSQLPTSLRLAGENILLRLLADAGGFNM